MPGNDWTVNDFIIHLAQFDEEVAQWMEALKTGRTERPGRNGRQHVRRGRVQQRPDRGAARLAAGPHPGREGDVNRAKLTAVMEELEDAHIEQVVHFPGDNKRPAADVQFKLFLMGLARHDPIHVADMLKALPERAADPAIVAWMNDGAVKWYQNAMSGPPPLVPRVILRGPQDER